MAAAKRRRESDELEDSALESSEIANIINIFSVKKVKGDSLHELKDADLERNGVQSEERRREYLKLLKPIREKAWKAYLSKYDLCDPMEFRVFNDPIHGHIALHPLCMKIVDTPQFQRLRYLRQLGGCYLVFPGASHSRFEHSLGVCHLAGELLKAIQERQPELMIKKKDVLCVQIAGLCHDLGHGPFSHLFDGRFIPLARPNEKWKHENASVKMFDYLIEQNDLRQCFDKYGLHEEDITFIKEQIDESLTGDANDMEWKYQGRPKTQGFLYDVVANKRTGIDVDKFDYLSRDCYNLGIKNNFDHLRFMKFARVLEVDGELQICSRDKEAGNLYELFHTRQTLYRKAYFHTVALSIEEMITEAFLEADEHLLFPGKDGQMLKLSETIDDMAVYSRVNDHVYHRILYSTEPELERAREILNKVEHRELYKCVGESRPLKGRKLQRNKTEPNIKAKIVRDLRRPDLQADDLVISIATFDYGMKENNPLDNVRFYKKNEPTWEFPIERNEVSQMLPGIFAEQILKVFCKKGYSTSLRDDVERWLRIFEERASREDVEAALEMTQI